MRFTFFAFILAVQICVGADKNEKLLNEGREYLYNFNLTKAVTIFDQIIKSDPEDPLPYYYKAQLHLWNYLGNLSAADLASFTEYSDIAIEKTKLLLTIREQHQFALIILGNIYTQRMIAFGKAEHYLDMVWASQKSQSYLNEAKDVNEKEYDAYLGLGLFKFFIAQVPSSFRWALNIVGYNGDLNEGIQFLKLAAENADLIKVEAQYYYAEIISGYLLDYDHSEKIFNELLKKYPNNLLFRYSLAVINIKDHRLDNAEKNLEKILQAKNLQFRQLGYYSEFLLGDVNYRRNDFQTAAGYYQKYITHSLDKSYTGIANYRLGWCNQFIGKSDETLKNWEAAKLGNQSIDDDFYANVRASYFLQNPPQKFSGKLIQFTHYIEAGEYQQAIDSLVLLSKFTKGTPIHTETVYTLGLAHFMVKNYREAKEFFNAALLETDENQKWIKPFAKLYLAATQFELGDITGGKNYLKEAESFSDFEYASKFGMMVIAIKYKYKVK